MLLMEIKTLFTRSNSDIFDTNTLERGLVLKILAFKVRPSGLIWVKLKITQNEKHFLNSNISNSMPLYLLKLYISELLWVVTL